MKVVVGGGTGLIGTALVASLEADGHETLVVSRTPGERSVTWDDVAAAVEGADAVVNLAGVSLGGPRWTRGRKQAILASRVETTGSLAEAIAAAGNKPRVLVTASGIDYYGSSGDAIVDESSPRGDTFLAGVCERWEEAAAPAPVRHVAIRTSLAVAREAQAVRLFALPFRLFVGGRLGDGRQWFPWIHLDDLVGVYRRAIEDESLAGPVNAVAPEKLREVDAARAFGEVLHRPALLPAPAFALRIALGDQADLLLQGQRAVSRKLDDYSFRFPTLRGALEQAL
jgi:uncharacterized protein